MSVRTGQTLFLRGEVPRHLYWVERGELRLQRSSADGRQVVLQRVRAGFVTEASLQAASYYCDGWMT